VFTGGVVFFMVKIDIIIDEPDCLSMFFNLGVKKKKPCLRFKTQTKIE